MSALRDLLAIETALNKENKKDPMTQFLFRYIKKLESGEKKKEAEKKGKWTVEDRICLGLLMAFGAVPMCAMYWWVIRALVRQ